MPGGRTKLPTALAIASEGVLTLIGVSVINPFSRDLAEASTPFTGGVRLRRNPSARQPSGEGCYLGGNRSRCRKRAACLSAGWRVTMIRGGFGPRDGRK